MPNHSTEISRKFFSRDFPSTIEVEWKASLDTYHPMGFISYIEQAVEAGEMPNITRTRHLGQRGTSMTFQHLIHHYYGYRDKENDLRQAFVLVQLDGGDTFAPHIKMDTRIKGDTRTILSRKESKPGLKSFRPLSDVPKFINEFTEKTGLGTEYLGTMGRDRVGTFITGDDARNWSLVADHVRPLDASGSLGLSQVELEYKGRNGVWLEESPFYQLEAIATLAKIGNTLVEASGILNPTSETKFEWLKKYNENCTSR